MNTKISNTIKFLSADMVQKANSGHPGAPMGLSDIMSVLMKFIKHNPKNPKWLNRDRLVFSGGHASALVYSYLYLSGYDLSLDDLKNFRQLHSRTPGHPEITTNGVEIATGPLGQGIANAVGFALASKYAANLLNDEKTKVIDHKVYCFCGDGDLEEGISYEACALAGFHKLDNLVIIYDSNNITIEGSTNLAWSEDVKARFEAQGFEVARIDGHDFTQIEFALSEAKNKTKPYLIIANTKIAKGALELENTSKSHGAPLGEELIQRAKVEAGFDPNKHFFVSEDVLFQTRAAVEKGDLEEALWKKSLESLTSEKKELLNSLLNPDFSKVEYPDFSGQKLATRNSNGKIINAISKAVPSFLGGSADLAPSNKTTLNDAGTFPDGKNIHFGIREHAMAAINNAIARYGLFVPFSATFFIFSDYLKNSARMAALMKLKHFFIFTHDSIGVGEDGPTHQPIEQLSTFRAMPGFYTFRPADGNENVKCWQIALSLDAPSAFVLSRQGLEPLPKPVFGEPKNGGYLIKESSEAKITLIASGSEVELCLKAANLLESKDIKTNVVSVPCFEILCKQEKSYLNRILKGKVLAVEAASGLEWYKFADEVLGMQTFGESGKAGDLFKHFGFSDTNIAKIAESLL
ncbi:transketolase [Campylobacter ureolyticus]|uniref:Transketolase n=1 Tax=Campylobacter ureolyticus TaxID=827 RepID=A0AAE7JNJ6_9BACT|nr:transketolase [Campylobacter ureolyticus]MCR8684786.1 transketolase [Campylobacter ureolyticus]QKF83667.1 transketolase [Campylobacter ureolyticus]QQY36176.1 transketolase [Campylobacter ureolyticus]SUX25047.1 transketolase [Campylobacter ureolyticus]